jgi:NodT family efflux transporter outer membrane factor (OMF) lipoprotein
MISAGLRAAGLHACLTACLTLAACSAVGPTYQVPADAMVNAPAANGAFVGASASVDGEPAPRKWWRLYDDLRLNALVEDGLAANTDLRAAAANIGRAEASLRAAADAAEPQTKVEAAFGYQRLSAEQYLLTHTIPSLGLYDTGVGVSYQIDLFGQIKRGIEAAAADEDAARAAYDVTRITVAAEIVRAFVEACAAGHALDVARRTLELQRRSLDVTDHLVRAGLGSVLDRTRSSAQVDQFRANIPQLEADRRTALYRLAVLTGKAPASFPKDVEGCAAEPVLTRPIPVGDGAALLRRRPDIRQAERLLAAATARIGVATGDLYPKIGFGVTAGSTGAINDFLSGPTLRWGFGPLISWDFPQQNATRARIASAEAATQGALANFDGKVLAALRETESALTVYAHDLDRAAALRAARDQAAQASDQAETLYRAGREGALTELDADRVLAGADQALAAGEAKVALDQVTLFLALGGGWEE